MHPFFYLVDATACRNPHHRMALDALLHLNCRHAKRWQRLFLRYYHDYLDGAKVPDNKFKDFRNHVLHVRQNNWGGAPETAQEWYHHTVEAIELQSWRNVAYSAGILSHYITDILQPFHTGQSPAETNIHHAFEWSTSKAYRRICPLYQTERDRHEWQLPDGKYWLRDAMIENAEYANQVFENLISQYDFKISATRPVGALNDYCLKTMAKLIRRATHFFAQVLSRALNEIDVMPPLVHLHGEAAVALVKAPYRWSRSGALNAKTRYEVFQMIDEYERTGQVLNYLSEESRAIKAMVAEPGYGEPATDVVIEPTFRDYRRRPPLPSNKPKELEELQGSSTAARAKTSPATPAEAPHARHRRGASQDRRATHTRTKASPLPSNDRRASDRTGPTRDRPSRLGTGRSDVSKAEDLPSVNASSRSQNLIDIRTQNRQGNGQDQRPSESSERAQHASSTRPTQLLQPSSGRAQTRKPSSHSNLTFNLGLEDNVENGPSIGPKTAKRLARIGVHTIGDLVEGDDKRIAAELNNGWITEQTVSDWQDQARLVCCVPELRALDSQLLVGCNIRRPSDLASADASSLLSQIIKFTSTAEGQRILRSSKRPDLIEVETWIANAAQARPLRDATRATAHSSFRAAA